MATPLLDEHAETLLIKSDYLQQQSTEILEQMKLQTEMLRSVREINKHVMEATQYLRAQKVN